MTTDVSSDDIGTVRWFGETWHSPINDPRAHVPVPDGTCDRCGQPFAADAQGVTVPFLGSHERSAWHLDCWLRNIGAMPHDHDENGQCL